MGVLEHSVVVVAGASAGMGRAVAQRCAAEGAQVVMLARGAARLGEVAGVVGHDARPIACDLAEPDSVRRAFGEIGDRFGRIDALLYVAGVARIRRIEDASDDDIATVFGANLLGPVYATRAATPLLRAAGGGDIVYVSSEIVDDYLPRMVLYGALMRAGFSGSIRVIIFDASECTKVAKENKQRRRRERLRYLGLIVSRRLSVAKGISSFNVGMSTARQRRDTCSGLRRQK